MIQFQDDIMKNRIRINELEAKIEERCRFFENRISELENSLALAHREIQRLILISDQNEEVSK